jgi:hypothetical protein
VERHAVRQSPWRAARWVLVGLVAVAVLVALAAALTGLLVAVLLAIGLAILNLIYLPRVAARLRLSTAWLAVALMPLLIGIGLVLGGASGGAWGAGLWLVGIGLPRVVGRDVARRTRQRLGSFGRGMGGVGGVDRAGGVGGVGSGSPVIYEVDYVEGERVKKPTARPGAPPSLPADDPGRGEFGL